MAPSAKGKEKVIDDGKGSSGKRKRNLGGYDDGKNGGRKRRNRGVLQFFDDAAYDVGEDDASDDSLFDDDFLEEEFDTAAAAMQFQSEPSRAPFPPFVPKEEEPTEEELEKMLQERYKPGSTFITYAEDNYESKRTMEMPGYYPAVKDPIIWKVKCMVGRERHSVFCLMQKYMDLQFLGKKLQIISAFTIDHIKGFIYIETEKQCDINEACNGLCSIYSSRVAAVPKEDIDHLFSVKNKSNGISEGMWARVKNGKYKGDLAQVAAVNSARKKVTVKLIPRIDLQALAEKFGRGTTANRAVNPAPRLISNSELQEFWPLIQCRRDRDTNKVFEVLDGMMLKDGYLYKKVSIESLSFWGVTPTDDELLKFEPPKNDECNDLEWLSQLYGEQKKKHHLISDKGGGKGEGSSMPSLDTDFEVHDLVFFGRKDFGVVIGTEKDESFKIIKEGSEGPVVVTIPRKELKNASFDKKLFTALDQKLKNISINDRVRVLDGPMKDREGIVKRIYRGIIFLYNETVEENNGYICFKAQLGEKVELPSEACNEKGGEPDNSVFGDFASSPKSPLSPKQSDQGRDGSRNFNRENNAMFSVGQSVRIRVGPLKGYLCRVLAIRRSDVTVKLDSQHKILTVKCEHLAEVRAKSLGISLGEESDSLKPFDLLGTQDGSTDWLDGTAKAADHGSWSAEGFSAERSSWPAFPASDFSLQTERQSSNPLISVDEDANKGDSSWDSKPTPSQGPSWGTVASARQTSVDGGQAANWGNQEDKKGAFSAGFVGNSSDSWGKAVESVHQSTAQGHKEDSWGRAAGSLSIKDDSRRSESAWNASGVASEKPTPGCGNASGGLDPPDANAWNKVATSNERETESWQTTRKNGERAGGWGKDAQECVWNQSAGIIYGGSSWNKEDGESFGNKQGGGSSWSKPGGGSTSQSKKGGGSWSKPDGGYSPWNKQDGGSSSQGKQGGESSWSTPEERSSSWSKPDGGSCSWSKVAGGSSSESKEGGESPWSKPIGGSSSWSKPDGGSGSWSKPDRGLSSWSKLDGGFSSQSKEGGESFWSTPNGGSSSWSKPDGGSGCQSKQGGESSWGKLDGGSSSWSKPDGGSSSWSKPDGGSTSWSKQGRVSSWSKPDGGSASWSKEVGSVENKFDTDQGGSWGRSEPFGGGHGSGGRVGQRGRGQFGRGRSSFGQGETSNRAKGNTDDHGFSGVTPKGNNSSWNSGQVDRWDKNVSSAGGKESGWGKPNASADCDESKWNKEWGATKDTGEGGGKSYTGSNGGGSNDPDGIKGLASNEPPDWQKRDKSWDQKSYDSKINVEADRDDPWNSKRISEGGSTSGWGQSNSGGPTDAGGVSSSGWGQSKWGGAGDAGGGSSSGWGQGKWSGETETGEKQTSWSRKSNWNSDNNFGCSEEQNDTFGDKGRVGNWRGGRGGRWGQDRGGFGGRGSGRGDFEGHSDHGGFGGRGRSGRGGFGGRGRSDRGDFGDFGGRGGSDRGGFRGRGGFGGRGRGRRDNWNKNDSGQEKSYSWNNTSNKDVDWKSSSGGSNWSNGDREKGRWQSGNSDWVAAGGGDSAQTGGWNKGSDNAGGHWNDGVRDKGQWQSGNSGWTAVGGGNSAQACQWNKGSSSAGVTGAQASGWNNGESNWKAKDAANGDKPNSWQNGSSSNADGWVSNNNGGNWQGGDRNQWQGAGSDWNKSSKKPAESGDIEQTGGCTRELSFSKGGGSDTKSGGWNGQNNNWKISNSSGGATSSSWNPSAKGDGEGAGSADARGKAAACSWGQAKDGNDKGGW